MAPTRASNAEARRDGRTRPPRCASPSPRNRNEPRSRRAARRASPGVLTIAARRADSTPSSSVGWRRYSASETARLTTASPRNSSRSLCPRAASGCSWSQLLWTSACASRSRSRMGSPRRSVSASAGCMTPRAWELGAALVDVVDGVLHGPDLLGVLVGDLGPELLFEAHDELDEVQRIGVEVVDEGGLGRDLSLVHTELLDDDLLQPIVGAGHWLLLRLGCPDGLHPGLGPPARARRS